MFISINGQLGSGKSTICKILEEEHGFTVFSTGKIQREYAKELGISTLELNMLCNNDDSYDRIIDGKLIEYGEAHRGENVIFDSRMAWHFVKDTFKVHLLICPAIAAERVYGKRESAEETYHSREEAMRGLIERRRVEAARYLALYSQNMTDIKNYDLVVDTSHLSPHEICDIMLKESKRTDRSGTALYISPKNVYPTQHVSEEEAASCMQELKAGKTPSIRLADHDDSLYIVEGHAYVAALCRLGAGVMNAGLVEAPVKVPTLKEISAWEQANGFTFGYYPAKIQNR